MELDEEVKQRNVFNLMLKVIGYKHSIKDGEAEIIEKDGKIYLAGWYIGRGPEDAHNNFLAVIPKEKLVKVDGIIIQFKGKPYLVNTSDIEIKKHYDYRDTEDKAAGSELFDLRE